ncbi:MAG: PE-PGRS family protein [Polyangiaceae bacterium]
MKVSSLGVVRLVVLLVMAMVATSLYGCAASGEVDTSTGAGPTSTGPGTGGATGTGGMGAEGGMGTGLEGGMGGMGAEGGMGGMGGMDPCDMGCMEGTWDIDDNPLTGECGCEYVCTKISDADPIDPNFDDDNCDGGDGVVEECVYVSKTIGTSGGAGTRLDPVDTIAGGIAIADNMNVPAVCVSGEVYNEQVTVISGVSVYGGFDHLDPNFAFLRSPNVTTTVNAAGMVFNAPQIDTETHIAGLTINASSPSTGGASTYGVRLGGGLGHLYVRYNVIHADMGAPGAPGMNGTPHSQSSAPSGNPGSNGCQGTNCGFGGAQPVCAEFGGKGGNGGYDSGNGQNGSPGTAGAPVGAGASGSSCFGGGNNGGAGSPATTNGSQGMPGGGGAALGSIDMSGFYFPATGGNGVAGQNGKGGSGGGGGGGGDNAGGICNSDKGGGGGSGGCGGLGGDYGRGGQGGGGSFGVFAAGGTITVVGNQITTGGGGVGGKGGNGAAGQFGGSGASGGGGNDDSGSGGPGGAGSAGGAGGPGGGGGGGPSACLGYGSGVIQTFNMNVSCTVGLPGFGGAIGTNPSGGASTAGANGTAGPTLQLN